MSAYTEFFIWEVMISKSGSHQRARQKFELIALVLYSPFVKRLSQYLSTEGI